MMGVDGARWMMTLVRIAAPVVLLLGCSLGGKGADSGSVDSGIHDGGADGVEDTGDTAGPDAGVRWYKLGATLQVTGEEGDALTLEGSALSVELFDADLLSLCVATAALAGAVPARLSPDPAILTWWTLTPGEWVGTCGEIDLAGAINPGLELGVGALDPEIRAAMEGAGIDAVGADSLNGAYVSPDGGDTLWVYGVAGLPGAYAGLEGPATAAPLSAGAWQLAPVYSLPWSG